MQKPLEAWVQSLGREDPLEEELTTLQYSCLENPVDRGAWQAAVHGVTKSQSVTTEHTCNGIKILGFYYINYQPQL